MEIGWYENDTPLHRVGTSSLFSDGSRKEVDLDNMGRSETARGFGRREDGK